MSEQETDKEPPRVERWVYGGRRVLESDGKVWHIYYEMVGDDESAVSDKPHYFKKQIFLNGFIGSVYEIHTTDATVFVRGDKGPKYLHRLDNELQISEWDLADEVARTRQAVDARAKRDGKESVTFSDLTLKQVAWRYMNCRTAPERNALIASVVGAITQTRATRNTDSGE